MLRPGLNCIRGEFSDNRRRRRSLLRLVVRVFLLISFRGCPLDFFASWVVTRREPQLRGCLLVPTPACAARSRSIKLFFDYYVSALANLLLFVFAPPHVCWTISNGAQQASESFKIVLSPQTSELLEGGRTKILLKMVTAQRVPADVSLIIV